MWVLKVDIVKREHAMKRFHNRDDLLHVQQLDCVLVLHGKTYVDVDYT